MKNGASRENDPATGQAFVETETVELKTKYTDAIAKGFVAFLNTKSGSVYLGVADGGSGYSERNLRNYRSFYLNFSESEIWQTRLPNLTWSHYNALLRVGDEKTRDWYKEESVRESWSVKTLERNISTQYYYRLLKSQVKTPVIEEMKAKTGAYQADKLEFIKNPIVAEFLWLSQNEQLFASKYTLCLPSEKDLRREIEVQKSIFLQQQNDRMEDKKGEQVGTID